MWIFSAVLKTCFITFVAYNVFDFSLSADGKSKLYMSCIRMEYELTKIEDVIAKEWRMTTFCQHQIMKSFFRKFALNNEFEWKCEVKAY